MKAATPRSVRPRIVLSVAGPGSGGGDGDGERRRTGVDAAEDRPGAMPLAALSARFVAASAFAFFRFFGRDDSALDCEIDGAILRSS